MLWRHLCLARAWLAAGFLTCSVLAVSAPAEPAEPAPSATAVTETVRVLDAKKSGDLALEVRGQGQDRVRVSIRNTSNKRLNVVLPPGLVAASAVGQGGRGAAGGAGFQSMGLGTPTNRLGSFGQFQEPSEPAPGLQSIPVASDPMRQSTVTVPVGQTVDLTIPAVCLNFGMPTPSFRDKFVLMDVEEYTVDPRARKALRSLATLGTSQGVAQAAMWRVCNGVPFEAMIARGGKVLNPHEVALAARFVEALDASGPSDTIDRAYLAESRVFVQVQGEGALADDAARLSQALDGLHLLGLPIRVVTDRELPEASAPALLLSVMLNGGKTGETRGQVHVRHAVRGAGWAPLGKTTLAVGSSASVIDGPEFARSLDHAIASAFISVKVAKKGPHSTTLKVTNRLPFTLAGATLKAGGSSGSPAVPFSGLGIGPARSALVPIQAAGGTIDRVELNGL
jgi:hypothetical protein